MLFHCYLLIIPIQGLISGATVQVPSINVACMVDQPPFSYLSLGGTTCQGYMVDLWREVSLSSPQYFSNCTLLPHSQAMTTLYDPTILNGTSRTIDIALGGFGITADGLEVVDFSVSLMETDYVVALLTKYDQNSDPSVLNSIFRRSVILIFGILALVNWGLAILIVLFERRAGNEVFMHMFERRFADALCTTFNLLEPENQVELKSVWTRVMISVYKLVSLFLMTIFTSLITSKLTANTISNNYVTLDEMAMLRIGVMKDAITIPLLSLKRIEYVECDNFIQCAEDFLSNGNPQQLDGIHSNSLTMDYLLSSYAKDWNPVLSLPFTINGSASNFGIPTRHFFPYGRELNLALQSLRDGGIINDLNQKYFEYQYQVENGDEVYVTDFEFYAMIAVNVILYVGLVLFVLYLIYMNKSHNSQRKMDKEAKVKSEGSNTLREENQPSSLDEVVLQMEKLKDKLHELSTQVKQISASSREVIKVNADP